jgi:hypothetical protein
LIQNIHVFFGPVLSYLAVISAILARETVPVDGGQAGRQLDSLGSLAVNLCSDYVAFQRVHSVRRLGCKKYKNLNKLAGRNLRKIKAKILLFKKNQCEDSAMCCLNMPAFLIPVLLYVGPMSCKSPRSTVPYR